MALPANGIIVLECGHVFNVNCFNRWSEDHNNCPVCRRPLIPGMPIDVDDASTEPESSDEPSDDEDDEEWLPPVETSGTNECSTDDEIDVVGVESVEQPVSNVELAASRKRSLESSDEDDYEEPVLRRRRLI